MMINFSPVLNPDLFMQNVGLLESHLTSEHLYDGCLFLELTLFQL